MLVENQKIKVTWGRNNQQHYIDKGYTYTKPGDVFYVDANDLPPTSKTIVKAECDYCHKIFDIEYGRYIFSISQPIHKCACAKCAGKKSSERLRSDNSKKHYQEFIQLCEQYGYSPLSPYSNDINSKTRLEYICPIHGRQDSILSYLRQYGCPQCKEDNRLRQYAQKTYDLFIELCSKRGYTPLSTVDEIKNEESWFRYECPKHGEQKIRLRDFKRGHGCTQCKYDYCADKLRLSIDDVVRQIESKNNNKLLNPEQYERAGKNNLLIQCGSCGNIFRYSLNNYQKLYDGKCSLCSDRSVGERIVRDVLVKHNIKYDSQHSFPDCKNIHVLLFDFYLPDYNCVIEFDGIYHYKAISGEENFEMNKRRDKIKDNYCKDNGIKMIRIPYWEMDNIEQILVDELKLI